MDERPIGVFDSGVGGLTVVKALREQLPRESIIYIGDTARVPYGTRSPATIARFACEIAERLLTQNVKALVVACNTISATCLPSIAALSAVPVVGVIEPTIESALRLSSAKHIAVIGTPATIRSAVYERGLQAREPGCRVLSMTTPLLVPIIEEGLKDHPVVDLMLETYLSPLKREPHVDVLILGCTHYPLIHERVQSFLGRRIHVLDSARPTAAAVEQMLRAQGLAATRNHATQIYFTSDDPEKSMQIARDFLGADLELRRLELG